MLFKLVPGGFSNPWTLSEEKKCEVQLEFQLEKNGTQKPTEKLENKRVQFFLALTRFFLEATTYLVEQVFV